MEKLEKVEQVREACGVSYEEAREALEATGYDVLEAIVQLERSHGQTEPTATYTLPESSESAADETAAPAGSKVASVWGSFRTRVRRLVRTGLDTGFVVERNGEHVATLPVLLVTLGLLAWGAALWLMVIGLFFGFRYRIEGTSTLTSDVNEAMSKAADVAGDIKGSLS